MKKRRSYLKGMKFSFEYICELLFVFFLKKTMKIQNN